MYTCIGNRNTINCNYLVFFVLFSLRFFSNPWLSKEGGRDTKNLPNCINCSNIQKLVKIGTYKRVPASYNFSISKLDNQYKFVSPKSGKIGA